MPPERQVLVEASVMGVETIGRSLTYQLCTTPPAPV